MMYISFNENKIYLNKYDEIKLEDITNYNYNINNEIILSQKKYLLSFITSNEKFIYLFQDKCNTIYNINILNDKFYPLILQSFVKSYFQSIDFIYKNQKKIFIIKFYIFI